MPRRFFAILVLAACGHSSPPAEKPPDPLADDPVAVLGELEARLLGASEVVIEANARADGVLSAQVEGTIRVVRDGVSTIEVDGSMQQMKLSNTWSSEKPVDEAARDTQPGVWADSLLLGATRMGVMHNWAMVLGKLDPSTYHGDMASYVEVVDIDWKGDPSERTIGFRIVAGGVESGSAALTLDENGLPKSRAQVVYFQEGDMSVLEQYSSFVVK
jgi:hypothetical protein